MSIYKYKLTVGEIRKKLEGVADDVEVLFNVEMPGGDNWDTFDVSVTNDSYMCYGDPGCTHTEPEMYWDVIFFVRHYAVGEDSITSRK